MRYKKRNIIYRAAMLLILLVSGWAAGARLSAEVESSVTLLPDAGQNLTGTPNADGTVIQPLTAWNDADTGIYFSFDTGTGGNAPAYYANGANIRLYSGNTFKVHVPEGYTVTRIVFYNNYAKSTETTLTVDSGSLLYETVATEEGTTEQAYIWNNEEATDVATFTVNDTQLRFNKVEMTVISGSEIVSRPKMPELSQKSSTFYRAFELAIVDINEPSAEIYYTLDGSEPSADNGTKYTAPITIPEGSDVTVKAVSVNENGTSPVASATYTFEKRYVLTLEPSSKSALSSAEYYTYYGSGSGSLLNGAKAYIVPGEEVQVYMSLNSGYKRKSLTMNGEPLELNGSSVTFTMPESNVVLKLETEFDPSSPGDPQLPEQKYKLTLVANPAGAWSGSVRELSAGESIHISCSGSSGYKFLNWAKDGETVSATNGLDYTMPASDVVLTANFVYAPSNPGDPEQPKLTHPLTAVAEPAGAATFSKSADRVVNGESYYVSASPQTGYKFRGWVLNGVKQEETSTTFRGVMTESGASLKALFVYNPSSPDEPNKNFYDPNSGRMILDHFQPGNLWSTALTLVNDLSQVQSLTVKGKITENDLNILSYFENLQAFDFSRTTGAGRIPSDYLNGIPVQSAIFPADIAEVYCYAFSGCQNLTAVSVFAQTPPAISGGVSSFSDFDASACELRVPEESIELYRAADGWKDFGTIVPLGDAVHVLEVQLPSAYRDGRLKNNRIEVINAATGHRQRYVITDRPIYTFNGVQKDDEYLILMISESGLEMSRIENVVIPDHDYAVAFTKIREMVPVEAKVTTPDNEDVTGACTLEWYEVSKDNSRKYLAKGATLGNVPEQQTIALSVTLSRDLALKYGMPSDSVFTVEPSAGTVAMTLAPLRATALSGRVLDEDGEPMANASVNVSQRIAGKYDRSWSASLGKDGTWSATVVEAPLTTVTYTQPESLARTDTVTPDMEKTGNDLGEVRLRSTVGARVRLSLAMTAAAPKGESGERTEITDASNISFAVTNVTKNTKCPASLQFPTLLVLDQTIEPDDELAITATGADGSFKPVTVTVKAGADLRPEASFELKGKGAVRASYEKTDSPEVMGMLYNANGKLVKKALFEDSQLTLTDLEDGTYTLVAMTKSEILNAAATLGVLDELGLTRVKDYTSAPVEVEDGVLSVVGLKTVPSCDESLYSFTGSQTSVTPNKNSVTSGQYLTIRSTLNFKTVYRDRIDNIRMEYTLPEGCRMVQNSVMKGSDKFGYDMQGDMVVVDLKKNYSDQVRFCVIPTQPGETGITARVLFDLDGQPMSQPVGTAVAQVKDFEFIVPNRTGYSELTATGSAPARSKVQVFQDGTLIGEGQATQSGDWTVNCMLVDIFNQKACGLQAKVTTPEGLELQSTVRNVVFDRNTIMIDRVTMLTGSEEVVFDYNHRDNTQVYTWVDNRLFTFIVKLTENAPEKVSDVILWVNTLDGGEQAFNCYYSESRDAWLAVGNFTSATAPVNVAVSVIGSEGLKYDRAEFDSYAAKAEAAKEDVESMKAEIAELERLDAEDKVAADAVIAVLDNVINNIESADDATMAQLVDSVLEAYGEEKEVFDYDQSLIGDENEINRILEETNRLTMPRPIPDYSGIRQLEEVVEELESRPTITKDFEFKTSVSDLAGIIDGSTYKFEEIPASDVALDSYASGSISELTLDDGSVLKIVADGTTIILVDEKNDKAWRISESSAQSDVMKAPGGPLDRLRRNIDNLTSFASRIMTTLQPLVQTIENEVSDALKAMNEAKKYSEELNQRIISNNEVLRYTRRELAKIEAQEAQGNLTPDLKKQLEQSKKRLEKNVEDLSKECKSVSKELRQAKSCLSKTRSKWILAKTVLSKVMQYYSIGSKLQRAAQWGFTGLDDYNRWGRFIKSILPCDADPDAARSIYDEAYGYQQDEIINGYLGATGTALGSASVSLISAVLGNLGTVNPLWTIVLKSLSVLGDIWSDNLLKRAENIYDNTRTDSRFTLNRLARARNQLKCREKSPKDEFSDPIPDLPGDAKGTNKTTPGNDAAKRVIIDPAGYVYEGVRSNRVEGVMATAYYREEVDDQYGDKHLVVTKWDAEEYAQKNPLFTDAEGMYAWDVPPGEWQVRFEKEGYNSTRSEWLPVPPPQLEVNVEITQNAQPEIKEVHAYAEAVDIEFDKYMDPETLTPENIFVTANGDKLAGTIELVNLETTAADTNDNVARRLASRVRFVPAESLATTVGKVRLSIKRNVLSYAGIPMTEDYSQELDVEKEVKEITVGRDLVKVLYGGEKKVTVSVVPSEAGRGKTLVIANSSPLVTTASAEEVVLDEYGQAEFILTGDLPGSAELRFNIKNTNKEGKAEVKVLDKLVEAISPEASMPDGSQLYKGAKIELTTESENAVIWFTTDGSCPCDADGTRRKYTVPIAIDDDNVTIKAMTSLGSGDDESETVSFTYTVKKTNVDYRLEEGWTWLSHNLDTPVAVSDVMADEKVQRVLSQTREAVRDPQLGVVGTLDRLEAPESYKVQTSGAVSLPRMSDYAWNPAAVTELAAGWNWLGYPVDQTMTPDEAFASAEPEEGDMLVGQNGFCEYDGSKWVGTLAVMTPGAGYMYRSASAKETVYNTSIVSNAASLYAPGIAERNLVVDIHRYADAMPVTAELVGLSGETLRADDFRVDAFCGTECRGIGRVVDGRFMMNVYGRPGDEISFAVTDADGETSYPCGVTVPFVADALGGLQAPYALRINSGSGVEGVDREGNVRVVPEGDMLRIKGLEPSEIRLVEVYGLDGRKLISETAVSESGISIQSLVSGVYVVVVDGNGEYTYHRIAVR